MYIYKTTNTINGKIYVGQSQRPINESKRYFGSGKLLIFAIKKYGKNNFKKEIIDTATNIETLNDKERYWIKKLNSQNKNIGYNIDGGGNDGKSILGEKNPACREDVKIKMRKPKSKEGKKNIQKAQRERDRTGTKNSFFGKKHTDKNKKKMVKNRLKNNGCYHPKGNRTAKTFLFVSPSGEEFFIFNEAKKFAESKNISFKLLRKYKGEKYKLSPNAPKSKVTDKTLNSVGWSVTEVISK